MILHLSNDFSGSLVYKNLFESIDEIGIKQFVYNPIKKNIETGRNDINFKVDGSKIFYRPILNYHTDRIIYKFKISKILKDIEGLIDISEVNLIHSHTWYSDGGVAFELYKKYNIPYIITIRNTDINIFQKYFLHLHNYGKQILQNAKKIILISQAYSSKLKEQKSLNSIYNTLKDRIVVIPNGVDPFWIKNVFVKSNRTRGNNFIYVGKFNKGKNVLNLIKAVISLKKSGVNCKLSLVGGGGNVNQKVLDLIKFHPDILTYHGKIFDKNILRDTYISSDFFVMPSINETFGLVYVEAMLQGLPILYTRGEGIDGFYSNSIGEKVDKGADYEQIKNALSTMILNEKGYKIPTECLISNHDWTNIARKYSEIYTNYL